MRNTQWLAASIAALCLSAGSAQAALLTFDDAISGSTSYAFDGDGDGIDDVVFSTLDPLGFNTVGPGLNQAYIDEPGLEGTTLLPIDLRVDFLAGAQSSLSFGYAVSTFGDVNNALLFSIYDASDNLLTSVLSDASQGASNFPEAFVNATFSGTAAYATFAFNPGDASRYIIDNFGGTFGNTETVVPEPATWALMIAGFGLAGGALRRARRETAAAA